MIYIFNRFYYSNLLNLFSNVPLHTFIVIHIYLCLVIYRYTFFYILYPVGVSGELLVYWTSLGYVGRTKMWSIEMPNKLNFSFSLWTAIFLIMLVYIPCK